MCKSRLSVGVFITLMQIQYASGELSIDQKIQEGNRKRGFTEVRLVNGISMLEGRVEILYKGIWGTICDDRFTIEEAEVVCHMLGYQRLGATSYTRAAFGEGKGPIWLDELRCHGNENSLEECHHRPWGYHDCMHREDAGVKCQAQKKDGSNRMLTLELDMVIEEGGKRKLFQRNKSNLRNAAKYLWKKDIYYMFADGIDNNAKLLIRDALDEWEAYSCLHFFEEDRYNKIVFTANPGNKGCASTDIGMKQGPQEIHLGKECLSPDVILHEIGHALGFYHEHNRADRDKYIRVHFENITQGKEDQFRKLNRDQYEDFGKPYDYKSIMHYGQFFYTRDESRKLITIETKDPEFQDVIGKAKRPSFLDYKILNAMYECSVDCRGVQCPSDAFLGKNCKCFCDGNQDNLHIKRCFEGKQCPKPPINTFLFEVFDRINETLVDMTRDFYPHNTIFHIFSKNLNCSLVSKLVCDNGTWSGPKPDCPVELGIKLTDGSDDDGVIELMLYEQRGFICDDNWDDNDATVACRMMGFEYGKARFENSYKVNESLPILLDDVKCSRNEQTLSKCNHNGWGKHDCDHSEVAAVKCFHYIDTHVDQQTGVLSNNDCGKVPLKGSKRRTPGVRIVGGVEVIKGMYPWQVGIQRMVRGNWRNVCGGTIIRSHWILSAAHCFDDLTSKYHDRNARKYYEDFRVSIGDIDWTKDDENEQIFHIEYLVQHWQYDGRDGRNPENDIALLKIVSDSGADFNDYVQPACLPEENVSIDYKMKCVVSGWGYTSERGKIQNKLRAVEVPIVEAKECEKFYKNYPIDTQRVFCAGNVTGGADTCRGDSGGPLVCDIEDRNTVIGITSWGLGCGRLNYPGVYTKVSSFVSWIKEQTSLHDVVAGRLCPELRNIRNGRPLLQDASNEIRNHYKSVTEYTCKPGYYLNGNPKIKSYKRTCQADGRWDGKEPTCDDAGRLCPELRSIRNGRPLLQDASNEIRNNYKSVTEYTCKSGYYLNGNPKIKSYKRTCQADGRWDGKEPTCDDGSRCELISNFYGGNIYYFGDYVKLHTLAFYRCDDEFSLFPNDVAMSECDDTLRWTPDPPKCYMKAKREIPANGYSSGERNDILLHLQSYEVCCSKGYALKSDVDMETNCIRITNNNGTLVPNVPECVEDVYYLISVKTGRGRFAGTDADVYITLHGQKGKTEKIYLHGLFESNHLDETRRQAVDIRPITSVVIGHNGRGLGSAWYLEYVSIYIENMEEYYVFRHNDWVENGKDVLLPRQGLDQQNCIDSFDDGNKLHPHWNRIERRHWYNISRGKRLSLRECKQWCITQTEIQCASVQYSTIHKSCWGLAVLDQSYFYETRVSRLPFVYFRTCKQFD